MMKHLDPDRITLISKNLDILATMMPQEEDIRRKIMMHKVKNTRMMIMRHQENLSKLIIMRDQEKSTIMMMTNQNVDKMSLKVAEIVSKSKMMRGCLEEGITMMIHQREMIKSDLLRVLYKRWKSNNKNPSTWIQIFKEKSIK